MSHLPNDIRRDARDEDWVTMQLNTTSNVTAGPFLDWFSGHLNYQIEHQWVCPLAVIVPLNASEFVQWLLLTPSTPVSSFFGCY